MTVGERQPEPSQALEYHLAQIKSRWEALPEYQVPDSFKHLAVICDGNRRSAKAKGLEPHLGHKLGTEVIRGIMSASRAWGIKHLTFWTWSTENWKRDELQKRFVMNLAEEGLQERAAVSSIVENQTRFVHLGRKDRLPTTLRLVIENLERLTARFDTRVLNLALDYGGLDELARAFAKMAKAGVPQDAINANPGIILDYLDTAGQPNPDLVIRTGTNEGEVPHTSGFMLLQTAYAGWKFMPELFPELTPESILTPIQNFVEYERRFGK